MFFKNSKQILGFDDKFYVFLGIILNTHAVMSIYYPGVLLQVGFMAYMTKWLLFFIVVTIHWIFVRAAYLTLNLHYPGLKNFSKRLLFIPLILILHLAISIFNIKYIVPIYDWNITDITYPRYGVRLLTGIIIFFINIGCYEGLHLFVEMKANSLKEQKLKKESINVQLTSLREQLSPHFLFNSLNTLAYLIDVDQEKSIEFVRSLSNIYEKIIKFSDKTVISVKEEMEYMQDYVELLRKRYGDNLDISFKVNKEIQDKNIVPLSLQVAIENAVKHNIITKINPLSIKVLSNQDYLEVVNNRQKKMTQNDTSGFGIRNINNRYALVTEKKVILNENQDLFSIKFPLLNE